MFLVLAKSMAQSVVPNTLMVKFATRMRIIYYPQGFGVYLYVTYFHFHHSLGTVEYLKP